MRSTVLAGMKAVAAALDLEQRIVVFAAQCEQNCSSQLPIPNIIVNYLIHIPAKGYLPIIQEHNIEDISYIC